MDEGFCILRPRFNTALELFGAPASYRDSFRTRTSQIRDYARKDARCKCARGFNDATIAHSLIDAEGSEYARDYDPDEGVGHPTPRADTSPETEGVINCSMQAWVYIRTSEALRFECKGIREEPLIMQDSPETLSVSSSPAH
jgi:hypothetical protein